SARRVLREMNGGRPVTPELSRFGEGVRFIGSYSTLLPVIFTAIELSKAQPAGTSCIDHGHVERRGECLAVGYTRLVIMPFTHKGGLPISTYSSPAARYCFCDFYRPALASGFSRGVCLGLRDLLSS